MAPSPLPPVTKCKIVAANCALRGNSIYVTAQPGPGEAAKCVEAGVRTASSARTPGETNPPPYDFGEPTTWEHMRIPFVNFPLAHGMTQAEFDIEATMGAH